MREIAEALEALRRRWAFVLAATLGGLSAGLTVSLLTKPLYRATALVKLEVPRKENLLFGSQPLPQGVDPIQSQLELLRSRSLAKRVVLRLGLCLKLEGKSLPEILAKGADSSVAPREFRLSWKGDTARLIQGKEEVARARRGDTLRGPGFWLILDWKAPGSARLRVLSPERVADEVRRRASCVQKGKTDFAKVSYTSPDPNEAALVANALAQAYVERSLEAAREQATLARRFIEEQLSKTERELKEAEDELRRFKAKEGLLEVSAAAQGLLNSLSQLDRALAEARVQEAEYQRKLRALQVQLGDTSSIFGRYRALASDPALSGNPELAQLSQTLAQLSQKRASLLAELAPSHPEVRALDREIEEVKARMEKLIKEVRAKGPSASDPVLQGIYSQLVEASVGLEAARAQANALAREIALREEKLKELPEKEQRLAELQRRVEAGRRLYQALLEKLQEAKIEEAKQVTQAKLVDPAVPPDAPFVPRTKLNLLLGFLLGLAVGAAGAVIAERASATVKSPEDAERAFEGFAEPPKFLGGVPPADDAEAAEDAVRLVAVNLLHFSNEGERAFLFTSAEPGAGKSFLVSELAKVFAEMGKRVLVVDADARKPVQHASFGVEAFPGLAEVLAGKIGPEDAIKPARAGVDVLPAGKPSASPSLLFSNGRLKEVFGQLAKRYDILLVDSPPLGIGGPEAVELASALPWTVLTLRYAQTRVPNLREVSKVLAERGSRVLGFVINFYAPRLRYYGYYKPYRAKRRGWKAWLTKLLRGP